MNISKQVPDKILEYNNDAYELALYAIETSDMTDVHLQSKLEYDRYIEQLAYEKVMEDFGGGDPMESTRGEYMINELTWEMMDEIIVEAQELILEPEFQNWISTQYV